ncbi:putative reverse transcriptase domain-containing protein [Tanacetum coccineum]
MDPTLSLIMPSRAMTQAAIEKLVSDRVGMWSKFPTVNEGAVDVKRWFEGKRKVFLASAYVDEKQGIVDHVVLNGMYEWLIPLMEMKLKPKLKDCRWDMSLILAPPKCNNCGKIGHKEKDCRSRNVASGTNARSAVVCYECADKSFVDVRFSHLLDIKPAKLNTSYEVELADGKVVCTNTVLKGCTLNLLDHLFDIDLMPIELGTFDVIIGMDWLVERDAVIVCGKKEARKIHRKRGIPFVLLAQVTEKRTVKITVARCASDCNFLRCFLMIFQDSHHLEKLNLELSLCPEPHLSGGDPITVWARLN